jgi:betaine-aldehyde dehydrogenase
LPIPPETCDKRGDERSTLTTTQLDRAAAAATVCDEVFRPVLTVLGFRDDEAIALANDSAYGLAASAWTTDLQRGLRCAAEPRAGTVWLNDHIPIFPEMPHGGFGHSGFGKDMSTYSLQEYTQVKHVAFDRTGQA